ncbi:thymidine phosphorylase, partial [candidate division KSB1 bacterium]
MDSVSIITEKRDGRPLSDHQIKWFVDSYIKGDIPDYQMSAFLMAVYFQGMSGHEVESLTNAMIKSGVQTDLSFLNALPVDKHSTGGVGDKISLLLAPLVAGAGVPVPMMSGRGLGHTGGTLDKLESIPGLRTDLSQEQFKNEIAQTGFAMAGQTEELVPADKKMYALRDVTGTVPSIPLICASIISKKKAEGTGALVLDVKLGKGAFFRSQEKTRELAKALVNLGNRMGIKTVALLTDMDEPLGFAVGNWLETKEAILALKKGEGPEDIIELTIELGALMVVLGGKAENRDQGREIIKEVLESGKGFELFKEMVRMQGGDVSVVEDPDSVGSSSFLKEIKASSDGYIKSIDALKTGLAANVLGAGRKTVEDKIDPLAGIVLYKKTGDFVKKGQILAVLHTEKESLFEEAEQIINGAWEISSGPLE